MELPRPPKHLLESFFPEFEGAPEMWTWAHETFIAPTGALYNPDHEHLDLCSVLFVWSSVPFKRSGKAVIGQAQLGQPSGGSGKKETYEWLWRKWNGGDLPTFVITLWAGFVHESDPVSVCALVEHELYHCAQARDAWGQVAYDKDGLPKYAMKGHDVEEFTGVVRRYGAHNQDLQAFKDALNQGPTVKRKEIANAICACGAAV